ncbi:hypothetical protein GCM10023080_090200 [Streptomyces pseudoechinosporeus]
MTYENAMRRYSFDPFARDQATVGTLRKATGDHDVSARSRNPQIIAPAERLVVAPAERLVVYRKKAEAALAVAERAGDGRRQRPTAGHATMTHTVPSPRGRAADRPGSLLRRTPGIHPAAGNRARTRPVRLSLAVLRRGPGRSRRR